MLGIWGENAVNKEYDPVRNKHEDFGGSLSELKGQSWESVENQGPE